MFRLVERTAEQGIAQHQADPVRVYERDELQADRIARTRKCLARALAHEELPTGARILELGCGTADISGPLSKDHQVMGIDCSDAAVAKARERWPLGEFHAAALEGFFEREMDVVVLCEVLEHIGDPLGLTKKWLPQCKASVISHPVDEPKGSELSGGDHCWSFSERDFRRWFELGGHELVESEWIRVGNYRVVLGRGRRK